MTRRKLLTRPDHQTKTYKGEKLGYMTWPLHLAPADLSGYNVCPMARVCREPCLNLAGRGIFSGVQAARIIRTQWFFTDRAGFMAQLVKEVGVAARYAAKRGYRCAVRLNATSDVPWHRVPVAGHSNIMEMFPAVQFYDYTKVSKRLLSEVLPANYHLTFSADGTNDAAVDRVLGAGRNVAVVFRTRAMVQGLLGTLWRGAEVVDGDQSDARFLDRDGVVVGLYAKGPARQDASGFVHDVGLTEAA